MPLLTAEWEWLGPPEAGSAADSPNSVRSTLLFRTVHAMRGTLISIAMTAFMVWLFVTAARRTDAPWWKIWLLGRGMFPTGDELREGKWSKREPSNRG